MTARTADELRDRSRRLLVESVRRGASAGLTQREIADAIGRSQPEVSRLLRFHGATPLARAVEVHRREILRILSAAGGRDVRIFGSVARGSDHPASDLDLLVDFATPPSLFTLGRLEREVSQIVGCPVDIVPAANLRPNLTRKALDDAVPL